MAFLFAVPLFLGIAICVVPLQVGARTLAFPRAAAASFWGWLVASGVMIASYTMNGGPGGGDAKGVDLFLLSFIALVLSLLLAAICVGATVLALRAPGMTTDRTPFASWGFMVGALHAAAHAAGADREPALHVGRPSVRPARRSAATSASARASRGR